MGKAERDLLWQHSKAVTDAEFRVLVACQKLAALDTYDGFNPPDVYVEGIQACVNLEKATLGLRVFVMNMAAGRGYNDRQQETPGETTAVGKGATIENEARS